MRTTDEKIEALCQELNELSRQSVNRMAAIRKLKQKIRAARQALEFYADEYNYTGPNQPARDGKPNVQEVFNRDVTRDGGGIARAALQKL